MGGDGEGMVVWSWWGRGSTASLTVGTPVPPLTGNLCNSSVFSMLKKSLTLTLKLPLFL